MNKTEVQPERTESSCEYATLKTHEVGFAMTTFLEGLLREHVSIMRTPNGEYIGDLKYLIALKEVRDYNLTRGAAKNG